MLFSRLFVTAASRALIAACAVSATSALAASVNGCDIRPATLCIEYDLRAARLRNADLPRADLSQADLSGADLGGANLRAADLDKAKLSRANLARVNLEGADLSRAEMYGANLREARLSEANLHSADLNGAVLDRAQLRGANFSGAHLPGAGLRSVSAARADFSGALLTYADLRGADLTGASFRNATLNGADLTGARLAGAVFDGASTQGCIGCPPAAARSGAPQVPAAGGAAISESLPPPIASGCWARIYIQENFKGEALTLAGPAAVANIAEDWGFDWEPRFQSLITGPKAQFAVFDNRDFRDRTATFAPGSRIADLDDEMGVFRAIRSLRLTCAR